eukprot:4383748-Amphidinium_carterae.1
MVQVFGCTWYNSISEFRMVAEPRLTRREITGLEPDNMRERERGSGATEERETMFEHNEESERDRQ